MRSKDLPLVLLPGLHGEVVEGYVKELEGTIAGSHHKLIFVDFRPGDIVESILRVETERLLSWYGQM